MMQNITDTFKIIPAFDNENTINIVFCPDNNYAKYFGVLLQSIIDNSNHNRKYDILVFANDISEHNQFLLKKMIPDHFSLRFIDVTKYINSNYSDCKIYSKGYWSISTFYRLFIPFIMPDYKKVMYLDTDMCTDCSIEELFDIDFGNNSLIAVIDTASAVIDCLPKRKEYMNSILKLENPEKYFNAGFVIFNLPNIDIEIYKQKLLDSFKISDLWFLDQDIMNILFENSVKLIHNKWNLMLDCLNYAVFTDNIHSEYKNNFLEAYQKPNIIHYSGPRKPWDYINDNYAQVFWLYARKTPFYEQLLFNVFKRSIIEFLKPNWFKYYEYKIKSSIPSKKQIHYKDKFNIIHKRYRDIGLITK